ncbi:MAG: hypothetical protein LIO95_04715 [Clostridiales bacterium]|nr:hypothetical protein [Clostridiales bacterium]
MSELSALAGSEGYGVCSDEGQLLLPPFSKKGGCSMSTMEVLTFRLVVIGVCNLFIQDKKK